MIKISLEVKKYKLASRRFFIFLSSFFGYYVKFFLLLRCKMKDNCFFKQRKWKKKMLVTLGRHLFYSYGVQKYHSTVLLEVPPCSLSIGAPHVTDGVLVCHRLTFFSLFVFLFFSENYSLTLLVVGISTSVLIFFIFNL
jgi:sugar phosphate permease